jgi:hypothetical protein
VNAGPVLVEVVRACVAARLEVVLIGNAAAALQGAPVTTVDFDFMFRRTPTYLRKIRAVAKSLGAVLLRPFYPVSDLQRLSRDDDGLQVDFMGTIHGVRTFEGLRARATPLRIGNEVVLVSSLVDIIRSKRAAGRVRDRAVLPILEKVHAQAEAFTEAPEETRSARPRKRTRAR